MARSAEQKEMDQQYAIFLRGFPEALSAIEDGPSFPTYEVPMLNYTLSMYFFEIYHHREAVSPELRAQGVQVASLSETLQNLPRMNVTNKEVLTIFNEAKAANERETLLRKQAEQSKAYQEMYKEQIEQILRRIQQYGYTPIPNEALAYFQQAQESPTMIDLSDAIQGLIISHIQQAVAPPEQALLPSNISESTILVPPEPESEPAQESKRRRGFDKDEFSSVIVLFDSWEEVLGQNIPQQILDSHRQLMQDFIDKKTPVTQLYRGTTTLFWRKRGVDIPLKALVMLPDAGVEDAMDAFTDAHSIARLLALTYKSIYPDMPYIPDIEFVELADAIIAGNFDRNQLLGELIDVYLSSQHMPLDGTNTSQSANKENAGYIKPDHFPKTDSEISEYIQWAQSELTKLIEQTSTSADRPLRVNGGTLTRISAKYFIEHFMKQVSNERYQWLMADNKGIFLEWQIICYMAIKDFRKYVDAAKLKRFSDAAKDIIPPSR